jgi:hypothetical protein
VKIANGKDFWAGLMFIGFGLGFTVVAINSYAMGRAANMGPAYFPTVLGGLLVALGVITLIRAFVSKVRHSLHVFPFRWLFISGAAVFGATAYFGADWFKGVGPAGSIVQQAFAALAVLLFIAAWGEKSLFLVLSAVVAFGYLLRPLGLVIATLVLVFVSAYGGHEFRVKEVTILFAVLAVFSALVFVWGLTLPIPLWPG